MSTEITKMSEVADLGRVLVKSGFFADARDEAQAIVKVLAGAELGFGAIASMAGIYIVKGRVTLSANLIAAAIKRSGRYDYRVTKLDAAGCEISFFENGAPIGISTFTDADAKTAGLAGDNWTKYRRNMMFARAMSNGAKWYCPDIFGGPVYTPDELGAPVDGESGEVIEGTATIIKPEPPKPEPVKPVATKLAAPDPAPEPTNGKDAVPEPAPAADLKLNQNLEDMSWHDFHEAAVHELHTDHSKHTCAILNQVYGTQAEWAKHPKTELWNVVRDHMAAKQEAGA